MKIGKWTIVKTKVIEELLEMRKSYGVAAKLLCDSCIENGSCGQGAIFCVTTSGDHVRGYCMYNRW